MYTSKGQTLVNNLKKGVGNELLLEMLRPVVAKIPPKVTKRITDTGQGASKSFSTPYSVGWGRKRSQSGLQTSYKNFTFSGDMLESVAIVSESADSNGVKFKIAPQGSQARGRANYQIALGHCEQEGVNIIEMNEDEVDEVHEAVAVVIKQYLERVL